MASFLCFTQVNPVTFPTKSSNPPTFLAHKTVTISLSSSFQSLKAKATDSSNQGTKPNSIVCADCDGNGAVLCKQCKGTGVNSVDHFNGQFKAGGTCWLCRGKREILCGNCNGAGFLGGFMSSFDD
ncbi:protein BUNDLE SHEATH DEFECTIVE 2, chloroplastic isoform X2 [Elaeis guineensis]|uniref:Protein disulfide-isomerase LQY1, chloroplastic isoform X2 n=1 Tax=Elaeis guineensis var. tenera TaxID=51953 RepID=A0A6I9QV23_ELAGV|nr:protein disulfide-isomerase LQY1, chloroplastic isoform X2 [Elaeis guineensis]